ncbi:MAG: glycosyl transferase, family 39 [Polyangiaceae bacterium]|jgi:hypothetical protein|nr:glycosyl transferase, family 39 [Polyangiaceae bacterium]
MHLAAPLRRHWVAIATAGLFLAAALLRFYRVDESVHVDSFHWFRRSHRFWDALAAGDLAGTRLAPHPGVIMMWVAGGVMKLNGSFARELIDEQSLFALKFLGALVGALAASLTFPLLLAITGQRAWRPAFLVAVLLTTEPQLLEQSRLAHLDMAALGFAWLGLLVSLVAYERSSYRWALGAGALFGLGVLTKLAIAPIPAGLMMILLGASLSSRLRDRRGLWVALWATLATIVVVFLLWPAMWQAPIETLKYVATTSEQVAEAGHPSTFGGRRTKDPGVAFYVQVLLSATPYELGLAAVLGLGTIWLLKDLRKHYGWLALAFIPYVVVICLVKKKLTRYVLPVSVPLVVLASAGLEWLLRRVPLQSPRLEAVSVALLVLFTGGRTAQAMSSLPSAVHCAEWPGITCGRPPDRYFLRDLAKAMAGDWRERKGEGTPRVFGGVPKLTEPWLHTKTAKSPGAADYIVLWDADYTDPQGTKLSKKMKRKLRKVKLGKELATVRHDGAFVVRVFAAPR